MTRGRSAKRRGCLLSYSQAEQGKELTQPSPRLLAEPCTCIWHMNFILGLDAKHVNGDGGQFLMSQLQLKAGHVNGEPGEVGSTVKFTSALIHLPDD